MTTEEARRQSRQDSLDSRQFVAFAFGGRLGQHRARLVGEGRHQMNARHFLSVNTPQRLAIDGDGFLGLESLGREPLPQDPLKGGVVQVSKHAMDGGSAGATLPLQP
jgi:hypothetical protein